MNPFKKNTKAAKRQQTARREELSIESLESRRCMAIDLVGTEVRVTGSDHRDVVNFTISRENVLTATRDQYETTPRGTIKTTEQKTFDAALVNKLLARVGGDNGEEPAESRPAQPLRRLAAIAATAKTLPPLPFIHAGA